MLTPSEIEDRWVKSQDQRGPPRTDPNLPVDETLAAGLSDTKVDRHPQHPLLLNDNDKAA
jgi:hypothetical protein